MISDGEVPGQGFHQVVQASPERPVSECCKTDRPVPIRSER